MEAHEIADLYRDPRAKEIENLAAYAECTQYAGRPAWMDESSPSALLDRAPAINDPVVRKAISTHVAFCLGETRWPEITASSSEDDEDIDEDWGLDEDDSAALDRFVNVVLVRYARLKTVARQMMAHAMAQKSCAVLLSLKKGRLFAETIRASWCTPTLDDIGQCLKLEIFYPYVDDYFDPVKRQWLKRCMLYRRVIDDKADTVYIPQPGNEYGTRPKNWAVDTAKTRAHGLGWCPVHWYPFMKECEAGGDLDGHAIHEHQRAEIDAYNIALSQRHRGAVTAGDPTAVETGVEDGQGPDRSQSPARAVIVKGSRGPSGTNQGDPVETGYISSTAARYARKGKRKRGAGQIWTYASKDAKVYYLSLPVGALDAIDKHAIDLGNKLAAAFNAVFVDPADVHTHAAMSGKALAFVFSRQIAFCDRVRQDFEACALIPVVDMLLRLICTVGKDNPRAIYVPGVAKVTPILEQFLRDVADGSKVWMPPRLECRWGPYFGAGEQEQLFLVQLAAAAVDAGICTTEMAVDKLLQANVFDAGSAAAVIEAINKEREDRAKIEADAMAKANAANPGVPTPASGGKPPQGKPGQKATNLQAPGATQPKPENKAPRAAA